MSTFSTDQLTAFWAKTAEDTFARVTGFWSEVAKAESEGHKRALTGIEEVARLQKATFEYGLELSTSFRNLWLETASKAMGFGAPKADKKA